MKLIFDGDIVCFRAAAVHPNDEASAKEYFEKLTLDLITELFCTEEDVTMFVGGDSNFRKHYTDYKANRHKYGKPDSLLAVKDYAVERFGAIRAHDCEADDLIVIEATKLLKQGVDYTIVTSDKDIRQIPGQFFSPITRKMTFVSPSEARKWYLKQLLTGDSTDNIRGIYGIGDKKADKILDENGINELTVSQAYKDHCGSTWEAELTKCFNLIYMRKHKNELAILSLPEEFYA